MFRLLPKISFDFSSFSADGTASETSTSSGTRTDIVTFTSLSLTGLYNLDF